MRGQENIELIPGMRTFMGAGDSSSSVEIEADAIIVANILPGYSHPS